MDGAAITRSAIMSEPEQASDEEPAALRSAAIEALRNAARQKDPKEFDRLTRYGLALIERARTRGQGRCRPGSEGNNPAPPGQLTLRERASPGRRSWTGEFIKKLGRLRSWWRTER